MRQRLRSLYSPQLLVNKEKLILKVIKRLASELELYVRAAKAAHAEATHEQSKAENKYDTRGLEASYLARGQSKQAAEIEKTIEEFHKLSLRRFGPDDAVDLGAIVELENQQDRSHYLIAPRGGGLDVHHEKRDIHVLTPQSPLGSQLVGKRQGDRLKLEIGGSRSDYTVLSVC